MSCETCGSPEMHKKLVLRAAKNVKWIKKLDAILPHLDESKREKVEKLRNVLKIEFLVIAKHIGGDAPDDTLTNEPPETNSRHIQPIRRDPTSATKPAASGQMSAGTV